MQACSFLFMQILAMFSDVNGIQKMVDDARVFKLVKSSRAGMLKLNVNVKAASARECGAMCRRHTQNCLSFVYNDKDNNCHFGSWTATSGKIYTRDCNDKSTPTYLNKIEGKLYTSGCCPDNYQVRSQSKDKTKCLRYSSGQKKFEDAQKECFDEGGHLTMFKTKKELDFVLWLLKCQEDTWIGIRDNCEHKNIDCKQNPSQRDIYWVDKEKVEGDVHKAVMKGKTPRAIHW
ncbi:neurocan core protein [Plakobranchus ocellatus]|uniref:Neurocan core protein n=1 Tax=Plakobranchus ocellatus TaxID=259542 RepID=A0AAV4D5A2_9GAST|nr:neurocan core protein [Plakobranchus ocellatus]